MKLIGFRKVSYVSKRDGVERRGYQLHIADKAFSVTDDDSDVYYGSIVYNIKGSLPYVSEAVASASGLTPKMIGKDIALSYNAYGSIDSLIFS